LKKQKPTEGEKTDNAKNYREEKISQYKWERIPPCKPLSFLSPLSVFIRNPNNRRKRHYDSQWKDKRRSKNMDSRLKISGMTREEASFLSGSIAFFRHP